MRSALIRPAPTHLWTVRVVTPNKAAAWGVVSPPSALPGLTRLLPGLAGGDPAGLSPWAASGSALVMQRAQIGQQRPSSREHVARPVAIHPESPLKCRRA